MYYLIVGGIIVSNFISKGELAQELKEANENYRNKAVEVRKHTNFDVNRMITSHNKPYNKETEGLK